jgi:hypothetical protein
MKTLAVALGALLLLGGGTRPARAAQDDPAAPRDLQRLQQDLANLDEELQTVDDRSPDARELRQRADDIRDQVTYLKVKIARQQRRGEEGTGVSTSEIQDVRRDVRALRADIEARAGRSAHDIRIPDGTEISVRLEQPVSSATAQEEDRVRATIQRPVRVGGQVALPAGTEIRGIVRDAVPAERLRRAGRLQVSFDSLYVNHARIDLRTRVVSLESQEEGRETARKAGIGAIIGGVVGGLLKGKTGVLVGALAGGGVVMAQRGEDVELPEGTILKVRVERPVTVPAGIEAPESLDRDYDRDRDRDRDRVLDDDRDRERRDER